jgi:pilus assembly protein Flp/PilA
MNFIKNFIAEEDGVTAIEYALIAALIAGVIAASVQALGGSLTTLFGNLKTKIGS